MQINGINNHNEYWTVFPHVVPETPYNFFMQAFLLQHCSKANSFLFLLCLESCY